MCQLVAAAQGTQHVGRLQAGRSTGRTGRHRDLLDGHDQRFTLDIVEAHVEVLRDPVFQTAVHVGLGDGRQPFQQTGTQRQRVGVVLGHFQAGNAVGLAHADDLVGGQRARTHAALVATTVRLRLDAHARLAPHEQRAHPLGTVGLVSREAHQVDLQLLQVDLDLAGGLGRIDVEEDLALTQHLADGGNVLDDADLVVDVHDRDQDGVRPDGGLQVLQVDQAVFLHIQQRHLEALALQLAHGVERGLVLGLDGDEVATALLVEVGGTLEREVDRLGGTRGPDQLARITVDQRRDFGTRFLHGLLGLPAIGVAARGGVAEEFAEIGNHLFRDPGINRGRGGIIEIDRSGHRSGAAWLRDEVCGKER